MITRDKEEGKELVEQYKSAMASGDREALNNLTKKWGYSERHSFYKAMRKVYGVKFETTSSPTEVEIEPEKERIPYPDFKVKPFNVGKIRRTEEDIGIVLADWHEGKKTESYSLAISQKRVDYLLTRVMSIIEHHRPIRHAYILNLGDNVQGENVYQGSRIGDTECGAWEQINDYAIPMLSKFCLNLSQGVQSVNFYGVDGNHGSISRESTKKTNWDRFVYKGLEQAMVNNKNIHIHSPEQFYQLVNIRGFRFFIVHGDQVRANAGIPLFALRRKMQEWYAYLGGFHYAYVGHFHAWGADQINSVADYQICPPLVTGDEWALEVIGRASKPIQLVFGVHPKYARTFEYKLYTDEAYLPKPMGVNDV